jgi:methyl-accepting chemotaxis protein
MSSLAQVNVATAEESAASSEELAAHWMQRLKQEVNQFLLKE